MTEPARIRRGSATARPRARGAAQRQKPRAGQSAATTLMRALPISARATQRLLRWGAALIVAALLFVLGSAFKLPQIAGAALGEAVGAVGFTAKQIDARPLNMSAAHRLAVLSVATDQESTAMPLVDLGLMREQLLAIPWVREARVSRRLPDTIAIDIVERRPAAIWQNRQKLVLVDADGIVLDAVPLDQMPDLPLVIGPAANTQVTALGRLLDATPTLKGMMAGATWIGGRRWDVRFQSGEVLALPEGEVAAAKALAKFTRLDASANLLGKGLVRFDMRIPGKMYIRMSQEPGKRFQLGDGDTAI